MKVLVTGATGFLGGALCKALVKKNYEVYALKRSNSDTEMLDDLSIQYVAGDVTNRESVFKAIEGMDLVFHLAGLIAYEPSKRALMDKVNVEGTKNVVDACVEFKVKQLMYVSSVVAIGASFDGEPLNEESEWNINHLNLGYFDTKKEAEELVVSAVTNHGLKAYLVNPSTIYGPGDAKKGSRSTQKKVAQGKFPIYPPGGVNVVSVDDVVEGMFLALEKGQPGRRYILAGENITLKKLFEIIASEAGVPAPKYPLPKALMGSLGKIGDMANRFGFSFPLNSENAWTAQLYHWFDNSRAKQELGFQPKSAQYAIHQSIEWMKEKGLL